MGESGRALDAGRRRPTMRIRPCRPRVDRLRAVRVRAPRGTGRRDEPGRALLNASLEAVRLTAAAARLHVRVLDREAGAHHVVVDEVDLAAGKIGRAVLVDVDLDAL